LTVRLNSELGLGSGAAAVRTICVTRELHGIGVLQLQNLLEPSSDRQESLPALFGGPTLSVLVPRDALANGASPKTNSVERLADVNNDTHNLVVVVVLESFANGSELSVEPELIDRDSALVLE
jgi:hypothetical protein